MYFPTQKTAFVLKVTRACASERKQRRHLIADCESPASLQRCPFVLVGPGVLLPSACSSPPCWVVRPCELPPDGMVFYFVALFRFSPCSHNDSFGSTPESAPKLSRSTNMAVMLIPELTIRPQKAQSRNSHKRSWSLSYDRRFSEKKCWCWGKGTFSSFTHHSSPVH